MLYAKRASLATVTRLEPSKYKLEIPNFCCAVLNTGVPVNVTGVLLGRLVLDQVFPWSVEYAARTLSGHIATNAPLP